MTKYPIFLEMAGRRAVVVGSGPVAIRKAQSLLDAGARLVIVSDAVDEMLISRFKQANVEFIKSKYSKNYLAGAVLVIAATNKSEVNQQIYKDCQQLEILCNVVDDPMHCDFFVPAVVKRGDLQIAVSTAGDCPSYTGHIKKKLESLFTENHGLFVDELEHIRKYIIENISNPADRKILLGRLVDDDSFEYFVDNGPEKWRQYARQIIKEKTKDKSTAD